MINTEPSWTKIVTGYSKRSKNIGINHLIDAYKYYDLDTLRLKWNTIKIDFKNFEKFEDIKTLYKACKISMILKLKTLSLNQCISAIKAASYLQKLHEFIIQEAIAVMLDSLKKNIKDCSSLNDAINFWRLLQRTEPKIYDSYAKRLIKKISLLIDTEDIIKLIENLNIIIQFKPEERTEFESIINMIVNASLSWIDREKDKFKFDVPDVESYEEFQNNSDDLKALINIIKRDKEIHLNKIDNKKLNLPGEELAKSDQENCEGFSPMERFEEEMILTYKITGMEIVASVSEYYEDQPIISIYRGIKENVPISIKVYQQENKEPPNLFLKELEFLRDHKKSQCFLEYIGWFQKLSSENRSIYAIVTERFDYTLMDDIIYHYNNKQKYTYQKYEEIVVGLLGIFCFLESQGIKHKNIRPQNILITANRKLKITGFDLSDTFSLNSPVLYTNNTESLWKDNYKAPEITKFYPDIDSPSIVWEKCDVYSLGLVFLEMYSLLPIAELNTRPFWSEIEEYVYTFKPKNVALLLKNMLAENSTERTSFKESLDIFLSQEENKNEYKMPGQLSFNYDVSGYLEDLEIISASMIEFCQEPCELKHLQNGVTVQYSKGVYNGNMALIRTYLSHDFGNILPYVEEAKVLKELNEKHSKFLEFYGSMYSFKEFHEFSIVTEWCCQSLMSHINKRSNLKRKYSVSKILKYAIGLFESLIALKNNGYCHGNITPHNIIKNIRSEITIAGFYMPKAGIYSESKFPENSDNFIQNEQGYLSPEARDIKEWSRNTIEKSDIFSLGLVLLQMIKLESVANFNENSFEELKCISPEWISKTLQKMLSFDPEKRGSLEEAYNYMKSNAGARISREK